MTTQTRSILRAARRANADASVNLTKRRAWFVNAITYGFQTLEDVYDQRVATLDTQLVDEAVFASADFHNRQLNAVLDTLVERTTARDAEFHLPASGELQPGSENGTPEPTQGHRSVVQGIPMWRGMDSFGFNREAYAKLTPREMDKEMLTRESRNARWHWRRLFAAIFTNVAWTFKEKGRTDLTVRGLAVTGDGSSYMDFSGALVTAQHYTAQNAVIDNSNNPFTVNEAILRAHPANTGTIVSYIPSGLVESTRALAGFYPYNAGNGLISFGADVDLASDEAGQYLGFGKSVEGVVGESVVVASPLLPANYVVSIVQGVDRPLWMREEPEATLQGLQVVPIQVDSNFRKWDFYVKAGFAVRNPIAIAVRQISAASYSIPTGYDARVIPG